jgi:hypothetical protein
VTTYDKIWIVGTSESRNLFDQLCAAISKPGGGDIPSPLDKKVMYSQCGSFYFVNMCQWGCGCNFIPELLRMEQDLSNQLISVSCGLHSEVLEDWSFYEKSFLDLRDWATRLQVNGTRIQYRTANAVNFLKTIPESNKFVRNNFRYNMFRNKAMRVFHPYDSVDVLDAFAVTEAIFDLSVDHVHFQAWVYRALSDLFLERLCGIL